MTKKNISKASLKEETTITASPGNSFTRIHLDLADDGITLAMVGAASAALGKNRQSVSMKRTDDGITLAIVGAASAVK